MKLEHVMDDLLREEAATAIPAVVIPPIEQPGRTQPNNRPRYVSSYCNREDALAHYRCQMGEYCQCWCHTSGLHDLP